LSGTTWRNSIFKQR